MSAVALNVAVNKPSARITSIQAPTGGWNRRDPLSGMKQKYAVILDNWFPLPYSIQFRKGSSDWATAITDEEVEPSEITVNTLITYRPASGNDELWAFAGELLFDVSASGDVGASEVSGLASDEWNCTNFSTTGGNFLICMNGVDLMLLYDGTDWTPIDGLSTPAITGIATSSLINLFVHKERPYYIEKNSMSVWYPAVGAIAGALTELNLASVFNKGGYLVAGGSWSVDAGDGKDDYWCVITSEGEIAVYQGDDPGTANTWSLIGVFEVGQPIGRRCLKKYGGDLLILTVDGIVSATAAFQLGREKAMQLALTDVIQGAVAESGELYKGSYGWHMTLFATASMFLVNVPESTGVKQWAMNTVTKAWGRFLDWETTCFEIFNDELYFGGLGLVKKAWTGKSDSSVAIMAEVVPAFSYYGSKGDTKQFLMLRPTIEWDSNPLSIKIGFDVDFRTETPTQEIALGPSSSASLWGTGVWGTAQWGSGQLIPRSEWYTVSGIGLSGAPHMILQSAVSAARITSFDVAHQQGSVF
jgi:hypothetical protein